MFPVMALVGTQGRADVDAVLAEIAYQREHARLVARVRSLFPHLTLREQQDMVIGIEAQVEAAKD